MSYPRVNLLKKSEQRYQGAVSQRFILASVVLIPLLFIALLSTIKLIQYGAIRTELSSGQQVWKSLEPRMNAALDQQRRLKTNQSYMALINAWKGSQVSVEGLLEDIQNVIPDNMQLARLSIRSEGSRTTYTTPAQVALHYRFTLQGIAEGAQAENSVIGLRRSLLTTGTHLSSTFDSVNLSSMRKRSGSDGESIREFSLEGLSEGIKETL